MNQCNPFATLALVCLLSMGPEALGDDLPKEAKNLLHERDQEMAAIQKKADEEIRISTDKYIESLQKMQDTYTREAKLDEAVALRDKIRELKGSLVPAQPDPGTLTSFRAQVGQCLYFEVTGSTTGSVWGTDIYTDDSTLATAAVHAGVLANGQMGTVKVVLLPGQAEYQGSVRNGVTSGSWGPYPGSYRVQAATRSRAEKVPAVEVKPDPGNLTNFRGQVGQSISFEVTGRLTGSIWGTDVYTDDTDLGTAAVHAGLLTDGQKGVVRVTILPTQDSYEGSTRNGVMSYSYGAWGGSYRLGAVKD